MDNEANLVRLLKSEDFTNYTLGLSIWSGLGGKNIKGLGAVTDWHPMGYLNHMLGDVSDVRDWGDLSEDCDYTGVYERC